MGKRSRSKQIKRRQVPTEPLSPQQSVRAALDEAAGDVSLVPAHVEQYLKGRKEAETALLWLGRDAAGAVVRIGIERNDEALQAFGRRLGAVPPRIPTNLRALREGSVLAHVEAALENAPAAVSRSYALDADSLALFDPVCVLPALVSGGRPRADAQALQAGDIAWLHWDVRQKVEVVFRMGLPNEPGLELRLRVESGAVFLGPPEASDGPRLGTVRLDPDRTQFDEYRERGHFLALKPGMYAVQPRWEALGRLEIYLTTLEEVPPLTIDPQALVLPSP